jgi:hypothetical protein
MGPAGPAYWQAVVAAASRFGALSFFMIVAQCSTMGSVSDHEQHGLDYCTPTRRERAA